MKRYLSLFGLWTRQCVYKFLLLLLFAAAVEAGGFLLALRSGPTLEQALGKNSTAIGVWLYFVCLCALLCRAGCQGSRKFGYTLARLRVSSWGAYICHWLHNSLYFFLFWGAQTGIMIGLCALHRYVVGVDYGPQTLLLASWRVELFHSLLPLADWGVYVCNALMALALGAATAQFSALERRGKRGIAVIVMAALTLGFFRRGIGSSANVVMGLESVCVTVWCFVSATEILEGESNEETA